MNNLKMPKGKSRVRLTKQIKDLYDSGKLKGKNIIDKSIPIIEEQKSKKKFNITKKVKEQPIIEEVKSVIEVNQIDNLLKNLTDNEYEKLANMNNLKMPKGKSRVRLTQQIKKLFISGKLKGLNQEPKSKKKFNITKKVKKQPIVEELKIVPYKPLEIPYKEDDKIEKRNITQRKVFNYFPTFGKAFLTFRNNFENFKDNEDISVDTKELIFYNVLSKLRDDMEMAFNEFSTKGLPKNFDEYKKLLYKIILQMSDMYSMTDDLVENQPKSIEELLNNLKFNYNKLHRSNIKKGTKAIKMTKLKPYFPNPNITEV
jgi:hypothetical protein